MDDRRKLSDVFRNAPLTTGARLLLLALLGYALIVLAALATLAEGNEEAVMDTMVLLLFLGSPLLVWFTIEPEPPPARVLGPLNRVPLWIRFPFLAGGASGVVFFLLTFASLISMYVVWLRLGSRQGVWISDDDPVQFILGALYACVYVLLPVGLCAPILRYAWGRTIAVVACIATSLVLSWLFSGGPREPGTLTELGIPWAMIRTVLDDGSFIHYARDDFTVLTALAVLGVALNTPRVVRRWRALAGASSGGRADES